VRGRLGWAAVLGCAVLGCAGLCWAGAWTFQLLTMHDTT
jgi:hypothetical protein